MKKQKLLSAIVAAALLVSSMGAALTASADTNTQSSDSYSTQLNPSAAVVSGDYEYEVLEDGTAQITKYSGKDTEVIIPDKLGGKTVTKLGVDSFYYDGIPMTKVVIPDTVTEIGASAFRGCTSLSDVTIPKSVENIGLAAFAGTPWFENYPQDSIIVGNNILIKYKGNTDTLVINESVAKIGAWAFADSVSLKNVTVPDSVKVIGSGAFMGCTELESVSIYANNAEIQADVFLNDSKLTVYCNSGSSAEQYAKQQNIPTGSLSKQDDDVSQNDSNTTGPIAVRDSDGNNILAYITEIGSETFYYKALTADTAEIIGYEGTAKEFEIPKKLNHFTITSIGKVAFHEANNIERVTIPDTVTKIKQGAFAKCKSLKNVTIPNSVTEIGEDVFMECESLKEVNIPDSVTYINKNTFGSCSSLEKVTIPKSVTKIDDIAFAYCESLKEISIPDSVTFIGIAAFGGCSSLEKVTIPKSVTKIDEETFVFCKSLKEVTIPDSVTSIGDEAFAGCSLLEKVIIPNSVKTFGEAVFEESPKTVIYCESGSAAEKYAKNNSIGYVLPGSDKVNYSNNSSASSSDSTVKSPKTGVNTISGLIPVFFTSLAAMTFLLGKNKRENEE